jgi:lipopolysaccharide/colanic/teichoic acid biosynthesis glycosyltransferase
VSLVIEVQQTDGAPFLASGTPAARRVLTVGRRPTSPTTSAREPDAAVEASALGPLPLSNPFNVAVKQAVEFGLALTIGVALLPVMAAVALAVKATSRGEVIHRRRVTGRGGTCFDAYKFRTMVPEASEWIRKDPALWERFHEKCKLADDPRVTPIGRLLRKFSLDELPQLLNVLKGQMALVGPRMISPEELAKYGPHAGKLLTVKPGLTGLWQVSGRQSTTYDRRVELDMHYIEHWSLGLDLAILARTPLAVVQGRGAV